MNLTLSEQLVFSVVQIMILNENNDLLGTASGFIGSFCNNEEAKTHVPVIITNRHVLSAGPKVSITFTRAAKNGDPDIGHTVSVEISTDHAIFHPNENIDLAVLPLAQALTLLASNSSTPFYRYLPLSTIPTKDEWLKFDAIEEVIMAGYPKGLRDPINNQPIFRRGITATHPAYDFNGLPEFLVDMPCFQGCSGSPVFILQQGAIVDPRENSVRVGESRFYLLGIQRAIPKASAVGSIELLPSDDLSIIPKPVVPIYLNLGFIIKSTELLAFDDIIRIQSRL